MSAAAQHVEPAHSRLRLLALGLCAWHDADPIGCSPVRGEPGRGEEDRKTLSPRERDQLLLRLERERDDALLGSPDDRNVVDMDRYRRSHEHPFWADLKAAMDTLHLLDPWGWLLVRRTYVEAGEPVLAMARAHMLKFLTLGEPGVPVTAPHHDLVRAMVELDKLMGQSAFPRFLYERVQGWEQWYAAAKATLGTVGKPKRDSEGARNLLKELVREASQLGMSQAEIGRKFGLDRRRVSEILKLPQTVKGEVVVFGRRSYVDITAGFLGQKTEVRA